LDQIKIHPKFAGIQTNYDYDVAVITLNEPIKFNLTVDKVSLIPVGTIIKDGEELIVTGFGEISVILTLKKCALDITVALLISL